MHIALDPSVGALGEVQLRAHEAIIERILYSHLAQEHLFCLTPLEIIKLRGAIQFGPQARRALDIISRRQQDYMASLRSSPWHMALLPLGATQAQQPIGRRYYLRPEDAHHWLERRPYLYVENASTDGAILGLLIRTTLPILGSAGDLVVIRPMHGGGNTIGAVIEEHVGQCSVGMCVCDCDTALPVPPFPHGSTGEAAHAALIRAGIVSGNSGTLQTQHPFFCFSSTYGWGIENIIGPNVLELFFEQADDCLESRHSIMAAFPNFPNLSDSEQQEWLLINLKAAAQPAQGIVQGASALAVPTSISDERADQLAALTIPSSVIPFVKREGLSGRYHKSLLRAVEADLDLPGYGDKVLALSRCALIAFAADSRVNFA